MYNKTVWAKDAIDADRIVISDVEPSVADRIAANLKTIFPDGEFWTEDE